MNALEGMTTTAIARVLGVTRQTVRNYKEGVTSITAKQVKELADYCNMSIQEVLNYFSIKEEEKK